jgi:hypothetical protein
MKTEVSTGNASPGSTMNKPGKHQEGQRRTVRGQVLEGKAVEVLGLAGLLEIRPGLHREHHAGEGLVELVVGHRAPAACRVVEIGVAFVEALENDEMVEVPEDDAGQLHFPQIRRFLLVALGYQAIGTRRLEDVGRLAAIARNAATPPQFLERNIAAEMAQHDRQRRSPALQRLELQHRRRAHHRTRLAALRTERPASASQLLSVMRATIASPMRWQTCERVAARAP